MNSLNSQEEKTLLSGVKNPRHKLLILLMLDGGLRNTEARFLKYENCDFKLRKFKVQSLKKKQTKERTIPMSRRLFDAFQDHIEKENQFKGYVFQGRNIGKPIGRSTVNMMLTRIQSDHPSLSVLYPHLLRHTFATKLRANNNKLEDVKDLLGHEDLKTTFIYAHEDEQQFRDAIDGLHKESLSERLKRVLFGRRSGALNIPMSKSEILGRSKELSEINAQIQKGQNVLITGEFGVGKNFFLEKLEFEGKTFVIDDAKQFKQSLMNFLLTIYSGDKNAILAMLMSTSDVKSFEKKLSVQSLVNVAQTCIDSTQPKEYVLKINDITDITPTVAKVLERLKNHFVIVTTARQIPAKYIPSFSDFHRIELQNLQRKDAIKLIHYYLRGLEVIEMDTVITKVFDASEGNPKMISELCGRLQNETIVDAANTDFICQNYLGRTVREFDMSYVLLMVLGGFAILRYFGRESGDRDLQFIGSAVMIVLLFARFFIQGSRRRSI